MPHINHKKSIRHYCILISFIFSTHVYASNWQNSPQVSQLFNEAGIQGTFVLYDVTAQRFIGHNPERAKTRFIPASTFKIPHTLIGLSVGAVKSVDEVLPYGGKPQAFKSWEKDMGLRGAITLSNVPIYKELARRIGVKAMQQAVSQLPYGNNDIGNTVNGFWLSGPLKISAMEQAQFLAKLVNEELPFPKEHQHTTKEIVLLEQKNNQSLYGETGWVNAPNPGLGWWVGWVQKANKTYTFALNMDIQKADDAGKRIALGKASLKTLGILNP